MHCNLCTLYIWLSVLFSIRCGLDLGLFICVWSPFPLHSLHNIYISFCIVIWVVFIQSVLPQALTAGPGLWRQCLWWVVPSDRVLMVPNHRSIWRLVLYIVCLLIFNRTDNRLLFSSLSLSLDLYFDDEDQQSLIHIPDGTVCHIPSYF